MAHHHCRYYVIPYFRFRFRKFSVNPSKQRHSRQQNENESENKFFISLPPVPRLALMAIPSSINLLFSSARLHVRHKSHKTSHFCAILHFAYENKYILIYTSTIYVAATTSCQSVHSHASVYLLRIFKHIRIILIRTRTPTFALQSTDIHSNLHPLP